MDAANVDENSYCPFLPPLILMAWRTMVLLRHGQNSLPLDQGLPFKLLQLLLHWNHLLPLLHLSEYSFLVTLATQCELLVPVITQALSPTGLHFWGGQFLDEQEMILVGFTFSVIVQEYKRSWMCWCENLSPGRRLDQHSTRICFSRGIQEPFLSSLLM